MKNKVSSSRSENMRAIRSSGNKTTELRLRAMLMQRALRGWELQPRDMMVSPDLLHSSKRVAVFVDGCFWHGCPNCGHIPKTNRSYWRTKILRNKRRGIVVSRALRARGYSVVRIWECKLRDQPKLCVARVV